MWPRSMLETILELVSIAALICSWALLLRNWANIPEIAPIHFSFTGEPDRFAHRRWQFVLPVVALLLYVGLGLVQLLEPRSMNFPVPLTPENEARQFAIARSIVFWLRAWTLLFVAHVGRGVVLVASGRAARLGSAAWSIVALVLGLLAIIGTHLVMAYSAR